MKNVLAAGLLLLLVASATGCGKAEPENAKQSIADQIDESAPSEDVSKGIDAALDKYGK